MTTWRAFEVGDVYWWQQSLEKEEMMMRLFTKKTNVRRSTRSRRRAQQPFTFDLGLTADDLPPFGAKWEVPTVSDDAKRAA